jgi:hypothetical protein
MKGKARFVVGQKHGLNPGAARHVGTVVEPIPRPSPAGLVAVLHRVKETIHHHAYLLPGQSGLLLLLQFHCAIPSGETSVTAQG